MTIEVSGLSLYTHHGVSAAEREVGQRLVLDLRLEVGECDATVTDMVEDTVDYAAVCERVALVAQQRSYKTLERLCSAVADRLLADFEAEEVWVKAAKPEPPIPLPVEEVSVEVWRQSRGRVTRDAGGDRVRARDRGRAARRRRAGARRCDRGWSAPRPQRRLPGRDRPARDAWPSSTTRRAPPRSLTCHYLRPPRRRRGPHRGRASSAPGAR